MTPEEFVEEIRKAREYIKSGKYNECPCSQIECEWHGNCFECVLIHRANRQHVPECLEEILRQKVRALALSVEYDVVDTHPKAEFWDYLNEIEPNRPRPAKERRK